MKFVDVIISRMADGFQVVRGKKKNHRANKHKILQPNDGIEESGMEETENKDYVTRRLQQCR